MSKKDKRLIRLLALPTDYTKEELDTVMTQLGCVKSNRGKTSGSGIQYGHPTTNDVLTFDSPHPGNIIKKHYLIKTIRFLKRNGIIEDERK